MKTQKWRWVLIIQVLDSILTVLVFVLDVLILFFFPEWIDNSPLIRSLSLAGLAIAWYIAWFVNIPLGIICLIANKANHIKYYNKKVSIAIVLFCVVNICVGITIWVFIALVPFARAFD